MEHFDIEKEEMETESSRFTCSKAGMYVGAACAIAALCFFIFEGIFVAAVFPSPGITSHDRMPGDEVRRSIQADIVRSLASNDWTAVQTKFTLFNSGLIVGDASGVRFETTRGWQSLDAEYAMISQSKIVTGLIVARAIESGHLTYDSKPHDYFSSWPSDSAVTLDNLVSFTTGFDEGIVQGCARAPKAEQPSWEDCIKNIAQYPMPHAPGTSYRYGPQHLVVAAGMVQASMGRPLTTEGWQATVTDLLYKPCGITDTPNFAGILFEGRFPDVSSGMHMNARQWQKILAALQFGNLLSKDGLIEFDRDRTTNVTQWLERIGGDKGLRAGAWHYANAHWKACDVAAHTSDKSGYLPLTAPEQETCIKDNQQLFHSVGALGWYSWYDLDHDYYAVFARSWLSSLIIKILIFTVVNLLIVTPIIGLMCYLLFRKCLSSKVSHDQNDQVETDDRNDQQDEEMDK